MATPTVGTATEVVPAAADTPAVGDAVAGASGKTSSGSEASQAAVATAVHPDAAAAKAEQPDEIEELSDRIRQALECPVCMEVNGELDCHCPNGHVMCVPCLVQLCMRDAMDSCPMCRSSMEFTADGQLTARRLMLALPLVNVACRYRRHGCRELARVDQVARHEADCEYWPDVRCLVTPCQWLGTYDRLFDHVARAHPESAIHTENDRVMVMDANNIESNRRRAYLVKTNDSGALLWVLMFRESRNRIRAGVFMVETKDGNGGTGGPWRTDCGRPVSLGYRVTYLDSQGRCNTRSKTRKVGRWHSSLNVDGRDDKAESYTNFRSRPGRVEVKWFERVVARRTRSNSRGVARPQATAEVFSQAAAEE